MRDFQKLQRDAPVGIVIAAAQAIELRVDPAQSRTGLHRDERRALEWILRHDGDVDHVGHVDDQRAVHGREDFVRVAAAAGNGREAVAHGALDRADHVGFALGEVHAERSPRDAGFGARGKVFVQRRLLDEQVDVRRDRVFALVERRAVHAVLERLQSSSRVDSSCLGDVCCKWHCR